MKVNKVYITNIIAAAAVLLTVRAIWNIEVAVCIGFAFLIAATLLNKTI